MANKGLARTTVTLLPFVFLTFASNTAWAQSKFYSATEIAQLDKTLGLLEKQDSSGHSKHIPPEIANLIAGKNNAIGVALTLPKSAAVKIDLSEQERAYYKNHFGELRLRILRAELGSQRIDRIRNIFGQRLHDKDHAIQSNAIWWFVSVLGEDPDIAKVVELLRDTDQDTRLEAADELARAQNPSGTKVMEELLTSTDSMKAWRAANGLAVLNNPKAKKTLLEIVHSTSTELMTKQLSLSSLGRVPGEDVDDLLMDTLNMKDKVLLKGALIGLQLRHPRLDATRIERIFSIVEDVEIDPNDRETAALIVVLTRQPLDIRERLLSYRRSNDPVLKKIMLVGLMNNGEKKDVPELMKFLNDPDSEMRMQAEYAVRRLTGVDLGYPRSDLDAVIAKRKVWWNQHQNDPEFK